MGTEANYEEAEVNVPNCKAVIKFGEKLAEVWASIKTVATNAINGIIGMLNGLISAGQNVFG